MTTLAAYPGKIVPDREPPQMDQSLLNRKFMQPGLVEPANLDLLPKNPSLEIRNDALFISILSAVTISMIFIAVFRIKIFGMSLGEYIKPIWYLILVALTAVFWQYFIGINLIGNSLALQTSQWVWEAAVLASAYKLSRIPTVGHGNMFFLWIFYSLIIHGTKVSIRYFFYGRTLWYIADRFIYGSLLVMVFSLILGSVFVYFRQKDRIS